MLDDKSGEETIGLQTTRTVSSRQASIKAKKPIEEVVIDDSEEEDKVLSVPSARDEISEDSMVENILKTPNVSKKKQISSSSKVKQRKTGTDEAWSGHSDDSNNNEDDAVLASLPRRTPQRRAARSTKSYALDDDEDEVEEEEEDDDVEQKTSSKKKTSTMSTPSKRSARSTKKPSDSKSKTGKRARCSGSADVYSSEEESALDLESDEEEDEEEEDWTPTAKVSSKKLFRKLSMNIL
jgi:hypothetical protein